MKTKISFVILIVLFILSCKRQEEQTPANVLAPRVVEAKGYMVLEDSMAPPKSVLAGKPKVLIAGKPKIVSTNISIHLAGKPKTVIARRPRICTPGKDTFSMPKIVLAINNPFIAGIPEVVIAKDAYSKDQNSQNFSSFTKQEGLKAEEILSLLQDKSGNIWISTWGGGVSRYDGKNFTHFTEKEGLSNNMVWSIIEDKYGNLWAGTQGGGVSKYDGKYFTHYTENEGLSNNVVNIILQDKAGNIWFGTNRGVSKYDGKTFTNYTEKEGLSNNVVLSILEDKLGNIWFGTFGGGASKYDGKNFTHYTEKEGLCNNYVNNILQDKAGNFWFGTQGGGISKFNGQSFKHYTIAQGLSNNAVSRILEDKSGNLWFGTFGGGISKYDDKNFTHFTEDEGLPNNMVYCIFEDRSGDLWFGTEGGLSKYNGKTFLHFTRSEGLSDNLIKSIFEDRSGNLWFGTTTGGVSKYDGKSFTSFTQDEGLNSNVVESIFEDKSGNLWFGTHGGVSKYDGKYFTQYTEKEGLGKNMVNAIFQDKAGNLWFSTVNGGVSKYDGKYFTHFTEKEGLSSNHIWSMLEDRSGNIWFSTNGGGVSKFDGKYFTHFTKKEGLGNNNVWSILEDKWGNIWIGTEGAGLLKYDGKNFTYFTEKEGLNNDFVSSILEDRAGNLWIGTAVGLSKLTPESLSKLPGRAKISADKNGFNDNYAAEVLFKSYSYEDGFSGIGCKRNAIIEDKMGAIWIGADDRLTVYHSEGDKKDTMAPNMQLINIGLFNETIPWKKDTSIVLANGVSVGHFQFDSLSRWYNIPEHLSLPYNNNYLTFDFVGITTNSPKKVKYQYKLEGLDNSWTALITHTEAPYGNLPPGNYSFKVKAMNSEGYWSKEFNYSFTIRPPWWKTWWAYTLYILIFSIALWNFIKWRVRALKKKAELKHQKTELEMQALRAQMNPHFIFNCLSSINRFILKNESEPASDYLTKFSRLIRMVLINSKKTFIALEDELEMLKLYLEMEKLRFKDSFNYNITFKSEIDPVNVFIPPLLLQPFAENAIWHGLMHKPEHGHLYITLRLENKMLTCIITDDGIGRSKAALIKSKSAEKQKSMGLQITTERLALLNKNIGPQTFFQIEDVIDEKGNAAGTRVILKIPYRDIVETLE